MNVDRFIPLHGRCACGGVSYEVKAPAEELYHCHCLTCRRLHGSLFATYAYMRRSDIVITSGAANLSTYRSTLADWHFCHTCGCHLFAEHDHNTGVMWYMPATLDRDALPQHPRDSEKHIFVASKSPIEKIGDELPQYNEYAPAEVSVTARKNSGRVGPLVLE